MTESLKSLLRKLSQPKLWKLMILVKHTEVKVGLEAQALKRTLFQLKRLHQIENLFQVIF